MKISMIKKLLCAAISGMMLLAVGCGGTATESISNSAASGEDNSWQKVEDAGKLKLGLDATFKPMGFTNENDEIVGFDIDVAAEVCNRLGIELEICPISWDTKEQDLNAGTVDCIWNGLSVSDERMQIMLMSEPYMDNEMIFVVNGSSDITTLADLSDAKIGVQNGSTALELLNASEVVANGATPVELTTNVEALQQLDLNMVDAVFMDSVVANYEIVSTGKDYRILDEGLSSEQYAIGFRKGEQELCDKITAALKEMAADGKLAEISTEWFGSDETTIGK